MESGDAEALNDVEPDSPLQVMATDDEELTEDCALTTVGCQVQITGPALITVAAPITNVHTPVSITPAMIYTAVASLLAPHLQTALTSLAVSPCSERLLALSRQATPEKTTTKTASPSRHGVLSSDSRIFLIRGHSRFVTLQCFLFHTDNCRKSNVILFIQRLQVTNRLLV